MSKYIITESQRKFLFEEISISSGLMDFMPFTKAIEKLQKLLGDDAFKNEVRTYLTNVAALSDSEIKRLIKKDYNLDKLEYRTRPSKKTDLISGMIYYIFNNNFSKKESEGISYFEFVEFGSQKIRYYFDEELETFIGFLAFGERTYANRRCAVVGGIEVIHTAKSRGYGKFMYLSLFNNYSVIKSDDNLFEESLNIWVNVLPRYCNVWLVDETRKKFKKIESKGLLPIYENYDFFIASKESLFS